MNYELAAAVVSQATRPQSSDHGEGHWKAVAYAGLKLIPHVERCDPELVLLFALFHDSKRHTEWSDPDHGLRGSKFAEEMMGDVLNPERMLMLRYACTWHDKGMTTKDPTISVCWDADRLNLWRVGIQPSPRLLSTEPAKDPDLIAEAATYHQLWLTWPVLFGDYSRLADARNKIPGGKGG